MQTAYVYVKDTNKYLRGSTLTAYDRAATLSSIEYGRKSVITASERPLSRVKFTSTPRCYDTVAALYGFENCPDLASAPQSEYPDVPLDLDCTTGSTCATRRPTFWSHRVVTRAEAQRWVASAGDWIAFDRLELDYKFPTSPTSPLSEATLALAGVKRVGLGAADITLPQTSFGYVLMKQRADADGEATQFEKPRVSEVISELGAKTTVSYGQAGRPCPTVDPPPGGHWANNATLCFPRIWKPDGSPVGPAVWYKYVVEGVNQTNIQPVSGGGTSSVNSGNQRTVYEYVGQPRFAYDDTPYLGPDEQSWSSWRGFAEVRVKTMTDGTYRGTGSSVAMAETQYRIFRGLNGTKGSSGNQSWSLTDFQGGNSMADDPALQGRILESQDLLLNANGNSLYTAGGADAGVRKTLHTYALDRVAGTQGKVRDSYFVRETHTRDKVWIPAKNAYDWVTTARVYDADNRVREESRSGVGLDPRCITRAFGAGTVTGDNRMDYPDVESVNKGCDPDGSGSETAGPLLARSEFTYDAAMNVTKTQRWVNSTGSSKITTSAGYDTYNRVNSTTDGEGNQTTIARSGPTVAPVWEKTTNAKGHVSTVESDYSLLVPTRIEDANGQETVLTYDTLGRLTKARRPGDTAGSEGLAFAYEVHTSEPSAIHTNTRKPNGTYDRSTQFLDAFGQVRQQQSTAPTSSPAANQTLVVNTRYDELGRVAAESDPIEVTGTAGNTFDNLGPTTFNETRTSYDSIDRATNSAYYGKNVAQWDTTTTYTGYTTIVDPPSGAVPVTTVTDVAGRILTRSEKARDNSLTATTTYGYDALDRITSVKDPGNHTTTHKFDLAGRRTATDDPDAGQTTTTYSNTDLPVQVSRESGAMTTTTYDALNRPLTVSGKVAGGTSQPIASYAYDTGGKGIGRLRAVTTKDGGANYVETITGYTPRGKPVGTTWTFPALAGKTTTTSVTIRTTWDVMDRPKTLEYDAVAGLPAESVTNTYSDAASGLPETMTGAVPYVSGTVFAGDGKLTSRTLANTGAPIVRSYAYNDLTSRLASVTTKRGAVAVQDDDFTWNDAGNLLNIRDTTGAGTTRQCFARDQLARLTQAWTTTDATGCMVGDTDAAGPAGYNTRWQYSLDGNITQIARGSTTTPFSYAGGQPHALTNGLGTYTYNSDGQMVIDNGTAITWDPFGYLDRVGPATGGTHFVHAPDGTRLSRVTPSGTATLYVDGQEIDIKSGAIQSARRFYDHAGIAVAIRQTAPSGSGSTLTWQVNDRQGTADLQIPNGAATPVTRLYTDPYGRPRGTATPTTDRWWLGKPTDPTTGYTHLGARYYDPKTNRFLTPDPLIDQTTTQAANPYGYGAANPTLYTDPSGLAAEGASSGSIINPHTGDSTCVIQRCGGTSGGSASGPSGPTGSSRVLDLIESRPIYSRTASRSGTRGRLAVLTIAYPSFSLAAATYLPMAQSWNLSGGGGAGWALQTLRSTGAADGSPPGVLLGKKVINDTLGAGNPLTTRGLAAKSADAAKTGGDILRPLSRVEASTLDDALRPAKLDHVFVPKHNFDPLVTKYGTRSEAMEQIVRSLSGPDLPSIGRFEVNRVVGGQDVVIRGAVIDGVPRIGTAFAP